MTWRRLTRILHLALVVSAIFALTAFGILLVKANRTVTRLNQDLGTVEAQSKEASHTLGLILLKAAVATDQIAKLSVVEQTYWRQQNRQMAALFDKLNKAAESTNKTVGDLDGTVITANDTIKNLRTSTVRVLTDLDSNLESLQTTQGQLNQKIAELDIGTLSRNANEISANVAETSKHLNKITADTEYVANDLKGRYIKYQEPKPWYRKYPLMVGKAALFGLTLWRPW